MLQRLSIMLLTLCLHAVSLEALASSSLKNTFHGYSLNSTPSAKGRVGGMNQTVGPGFSYRNQINVNRSLYNIEMPSWNAGCGGIDGFSGSFSLITKDELVQIGRGIIQGAPGYFFNLALGSVCSDCAANLKDLQAKLNSWNQFAQNACENAWDAFSEATGIDEAARNLSQRSASINAAFTTAVGALPDYGSYITDKRAQNNPGECGPNLPCNSSIVTGSEFNLIFAILEGPSPLLPKTFDFLGDTATMDITVPDVAMGLLGTIIFKQTDPTNGKWDTTLPHDGSQVIKVLNIEHLFETPANMSTVDLSFITCDDLISDPKCLSVKPMQVSGYKGVVTEFQRLLPSIVSKIRLRAGLSTEELIFVSNYDLNYRQLADEKLNIDKHMARYLGINFAIERVTEFVSAFKYTILTAAQRPLLDDNGNQRPMGYAEAKKLTDTFDERYEKVIEKYKNESDDIAEGLKLSFMMTRALAEAGGF